MRGKIIAHLPKTNPDGSIEWEYLILTEGGELDRVPQDVADKWIVPLSAAAPQAIPSLKIGDNIVVSSTGKLGVIVAMSSETADLVLNDGSRVTVQLSDLKRPD